MSQRQRVREVGDRWASLFADGSRDCSYMTQPLCERIACERVGNRKIENCTLPTRAFRKSFEGARVFDVAFRGSRAAAKFSNGEVIELSGDGDWLVHRIGANADRGLFD